MTTTTSATHQYDDQRPPLVLHEISVLRAPGISAGFTLRDLSPDITIVFGPNASGKSTTARAIQMALWPHVSALRGHHLAASFSLGDEQWSIDASAARIQRYRNGEPAEPPLIAPLDDRARYSLALPDLLASENQPLAQAILTESSGGFDLPMIASSLGYSSTIPPRLESARKVQSAQVALQDVLALGAATRTALGERAQLQSQREESLRAERDMDEIDKALAYQLRLAEEAETSAEIATFAPEVHDFTGNELAEIADLTKEIAAQTHQLTDASRQRDRWQHLIDSSGLADIADPEERLKSLRAVQSQQDELAVLIGAGERTLATAVSERRTHQHRLAEDLNDDQIAALDTGGMREFAEIAASYENIRARRTARDEIELWLGGVSAPQNLPILQQGMETLQARLQHPNAVEHRQLTGRARWIGIGGGALLAGAGAVLAILLNSWWWFLAAIGVVLVILAWRFTASNSPKIAATLEQTYAELDLPQPGQWRVGEIRDLLNEVRESLKIALVEQEKADRWHDLEQERAELDTAFTANEERREQAIARYGVAPDLKEESLRLLADNLGRWQAADAIVRGQEARLEKMQNDVATLSHRAESILAQLGYDGGELQHLLVDLERRIDSLQQALAERDTLQRQMDDTLQPRLDSLISDRDAIYRRFNLDVDDATGMQHLQQQKQHLLTANERLQQRRRSSREAWESLSLAPQWRDVEAEQLTATRHTTQAVAERRSEIEERLRELDQRERAAMRSHDLEIAQANLVSSQLDLTKDRDRIAASVVGDLLLDTVQQETRDAALPIVFHRARELFAIITRGKYELQFEPGPPPEFTSLDTSTGITLSLDQLSSGTRVQLLMAIRLAFVENVEVGPRLPVILDETLGNSDEFRASAIIDAAIDICKHGRQVFYFTAQGEEVARWQHRVEAMPEEDRPSIRVIELAEVRRDAGFDRLPIQSMAHHLSHTVPSPADYDPETWAATLRVPAVDPWAPIGGVHLWHLLSDRDVLHALLSNDIVTFGQLESLERTNPLQLAQVHARVPETLQTVHVRADLLRDAMQMWRIGRARPMPVGALAEADMIDAADLDELQSLQQEANHDGGALVDQLQTMPDAPLAEKPLEALELWMIAEGYIPQGQQMSEADMRARLIQLGSPAIRSGDIEAATIEQLCAQTRSW